jgi:hypothetical protein
VNNEHQKPPPLTTVGQQIWNKALEDGAYIDVSEGRGIVIPADKILETEVRER